MTHPRKEPLVKRTLILRSEALAELTAVELHAVAGGAAPTGVGATCKLDECLIDSNMGMCYSWLC